MKQLFFILSVLCSFLVNAQTADTPEDDFSRMVSQNKIWQPIILGSYPPLALPDDWPWQLCSYYFNGFVEKNGKTYSRLVYEDDPEITCALMREEGSKVYVLLDDDFINRYNLGIDNRLELKNTDFVLYDFNLKPGDLFETLVSEGYLKIDTRRISNVLTVNIKGQSLRIQQLVDEFGNESALHDLDCVIEGFGPSSKLNLFFTDYLCLAGTSSDETIFGCVKDKTSGEVLLEKDEIEEAIWNSNVVAPEIGDGVKDGKIYDVMGREVKNPQPGSVYIQNGRKFIAR